MIFYIKLKKLKKLNKKVLPSFTILELILVIVIIGILVSTISIYIPNNNLQVAADQIISHIRYTQSLALKEDKYQPFPLNNSITEMNRSKYWFKQWWQIRFTKNKNDPKDLWYEIFSDQPYHLNGQNFDRKGVNPHNSWDIGFAKDPLSGKYLIGRCGSSGFPNCDKVDTKLNLTKTYGIKVILFNDSSVAWNHPKRLMFDNYGNVFLNEGLQGDGGDINPLDETNRNMLTKNASIKLCLDNPCNFTKDRCIQINITPTGYVYKSNCE